MIFLVLSSVALLIYGVKNPPGPLDRMYEWFVITVFIIEYLMRMWVYSDIHTTIIEHNERAELLNRPFQFWPALREALIKKWQYITQPMAIIDLLAILPTYRPLRILRIFLIFRLFKLLRYTNSLKQFTTVLAEKRYELLTLSIFLTFVVFAAAAAIYIFEVDAPNNQIHSFFDALYWSIVTLSTVGYGDITPQTVQGRAVAIVLIVVGIGVISFFTSIIVSAFTEKLPEINRQRVFNELEHHPGHVLLCGYGRLGQIVARNLRQLNEKVVILDLDEEYIQLARRNGFLALQGDATSNELLENLNILQAKRILPLTDNDVSNVYIVLSARQLNPDIEIIAKANQKQNKKKLLRAGASFAIAPHETAGMIAAQYAAQPVAFEAFFGLLTKDNPISVDAIRLHDTASLVNTPVGKIDFKAAKLILFGVATDRDYPNNRGKLCFKMKGAQFQFNPPADFILLGGDVLIVFGNDYSIEKFREDHGLFNAI